MKAAVYDGPKTVSVKEVPDARIERPTDALVRITTTNICGSDLHMYEGRTDMDHHVWYLTYKWARHTHSNKSKGWAVSRYFGQFNKSRQDRWVFGDRETGAYLTKFAWTKIVRHVPVHGASSPDDPALAEY